MNDIHRRTVIVEGPVAYAAYRAAAARRDQVPCETLEQQLVVRVPKQIRHTFSYGGNAIDFVEDAHQAGQAGP